MQCIHFYTYETTLTSLYSSYYQEIYGNITTYIIPCSSSLLIESCTTEQWHLVAAIQDITPWMNFQWCLSLLLPVASSLLSLSSSGTLLSELFLREERQVWFSFCSRPLLLGKLYNWVTGCRLGCDWQDCWEASIPWVLLGLGPDEVITGRGLLAWARV